MTPLLLSQKLKNMKLQQQIHQRALHVVEDFKTKEFELIKILQEVDINRVYSLLGYKSLFQYCLQALRLSEAQCCNYISVARKAQNLPVLQNALESREISISKARKLTTVITESNQTEWVELASSLNCRELEKQVAKVNPRVITPERARYLTDTILELQIPVTERIYKKLQRAKELVSQTHSKASSLEETLDQVLDLFLQRKDPVIRAEKFHKKVKNQKNGLKKHELKEDKQKNKDQIKIDTETKLEAEKQKDKLTKSPRLKSDLTQTSQSRDRRLPQTLVHKINHRDQGQCCSMNLKGERCSQRQWLHFHHLKPRALGGDDSLENLVTLCSSHHHMLHRGLNIEFWSRV